MDLIPLVQKILLVVTIIFVIVLIASYVYSKFFKKDNDEEYIHSSEADPNDQGKISERKKKSIDYTANANSEKLYVNTNEHRKHVVANKAASKPQRFKIINKTDADDN